MKKFIYLLLFKLIPVITFGQVHSGLALGYDTHNKLLGAWNIGYEKDIVVMDAEIRPNLTRNLPINNYCGFKLGLNLINPDEDGLSIIPGLGYYYDFRSMDKTKTNAYYFGYSLKSIIQVTNDGGLFIEGMYINKSAQITIGMNVKFENRDKPY